MDVQGNIIRENYKEGKIMFQLKYLTILGLTLTLICSADRISAQTEKSKEDAPAARKPASQKHIDELIRQLGR